MRRFLVKCTVFAMLIAILAFVPYKLRKTENHGYMAALRHKQELLDTVKSPRIIFIGGSNVTFGLDSHRLSDSLGVPVINTAIHAALGLKYQFDMVNKRLKDGDILVIMPEISQFYGTFNGDNSETPASAAIATSFNDIELMNGTQLANIASGYFRGLYGYLMDFHSPDYNVDNFNDLGDTFAHWSDTTRHNVKVFPEPGSLDEKAIAYMSAKIRSLREKGHAVMLFPPTMMRGFYEINVGKITTLSDALRRADIPFEIPDSAHVMPDGYNYDTHYHMGKLGVDSLNYLLVDEMRMLAPAGLGLCRRHGEGR